MLQLRAINWFCDYYGLSAINQLPSGQYELAEALAPFGLNAQLVALNSCRAPALYQQDQQLWVLDHERQLALNVDSGLWCDYHQLPFALKPSQQVWLIRPQQVIDARGDQGNPRIDKHWFMDALWQMRRNYKGVILASFVINLLALVTPLFTMNVYDRVVPNLAFNTLWVLAGVVALVIVFDYCLKHARSVVTDIAGRALDIRLSARLYRRFLNTPVAKKPESAAAFAKNMQDFDSVREFIASATLLALADLPFSLLFIAVIAWLGGYLALVPAVLVLILLLASLWVQRPLREALDESARASTQRQVQLVESAQQLGTIKQLGLQSSYAQRWQSLVRLLADWQIRSRLLSQNVSHLAQSLQQGASLALIIGGVYLIAEGKLSMGGLIAVVMLSGRAIGSFNQLSLLLLRYQQCRAALTGIDNLMSNEQEPEATPQQASFALNGDIRCENLSFTYANAQLPSLNAVDLQLKAGERVALVGSTGAGKSTLLKILAAQLMPSQGIIQFNGINVAQWQLAALRRQIAYVPQQPVLVYGSIWQNLTLGLPATDVESAQQLITQLDLSAWINRLPQGVQTPVGELGEQLSAGQRQQIVIVRALLAKTPLLLLDEPSSALDSQHAVLMLKRLAQLAPNTTVVIASHDPLVTQQCQRALVLKDGQIVGERPVGRVAGNSSAVSVQKVERSHVK